MQPKTGSWPSSLCLCNSYSKLSTSNQLGDLKNLATCHWLKQIFHLSTLASFFRMYFVITWIILEIQKLKKASSPILVHDGIMDLVGRSEKVKTLNNINFLIQVVKATISSLTLATSITTIAIKIQIIVVQQSTHLSMKGFYLGKHLL